LRIIPIDSISAANKQPAARHPEPSVATPRRQRGETIVERVLLLIAAIFFALHFVHLKADFPNHSQWMDWSKYTDEGWYGDAAIRHHQLGHWDVPGDFNPAVALPVWPALETVLFSMTGVSLVAARALTVTVFGLILICSYTLIWRWSSEPQHRDRIEGQPISLAPSIAVLLLAVNPLCFVFSRLAILEPLLVLVTLVALLMASAAGDASAAAWSAGVAADAKVKQLRCRVSAAALGLLLPLIVLTKTTGVFLFPAIFWLLWASARYRWRPFVRAAALACGVGVAVWAAYYLLFVRPHYLMDYRYLFSANAYTGITVDTFWTVLHDALVDVSWIGITLSVLAMTAVVGSVVLVAARRSRSNPLMVGLLLWIFGYAAFLVYHANLQPRYYLVITIPLMLLTAVELDALIAAAFAAGSGKRLVQGMALVLSGVLVFAVVRGGVQVLGYVRHPEYRWWNAAQQIRSVVDREAATSQAKGGVAHSRLVLSISGSDISLMTGLPSICDDFGTMALADRVAAYRPGWFATWNDVEDDKMEALAPLYRMERVAAIPVFDDPERNVLILYRLDALSSPGSRGRSGRRRFLSVPRRLRTPVGEQPSAVQLTH
jgi:4-amino-4-deoxy-L-arabinose transferase-like glycosyltransferase